MNRIDDRQAITDVLYRYARAVDRLDYTAIEACYFPDAVDNHGGYVGTAEGLVADIRARHRTIDSSQHFISNVLIDFTAEASAEVEAYCLCYLRQRPDPDTREQELAVIRCRYVDRFEKRGRDWRIAARTVVFDEHRKVSVIDELDTSWVASTRDATDPVFRGR